MNKLNVVKWPLLLLFLLGSIPYTFAQSDPNVRDLLLLVKWFEGEFDNDSQLWYEGRRKVPEAERHGRIHATHTKIQADFLGEHTFYVEEYIDDDTTKIARQRVVSFKSMAPEEGIEMEIYFLKEADKFVGADGDASVFKELKQEDLFGLDGCAVIFQRKGEQYFGSMRDKACQFGEGDLLRYSVHDLVVSQNQYWRVDRSFLVKDDSFYKGHPNDIPHKMRLAERYTCDVSFYEKSYAEPDPNDKSYKGLTVHNQGGFTWVTYPKNGKKYGVQLREKEYPFYGEGADFFMMRFIEEGQKRSTILVTAQPGATKLSFNNGWASCFCKKDENKP
ncbi:MAG: chromophore lyase CpcT/CpeT [Bacteroidota bacterium]